MAVSSPELVGGGGGSTQERKVSVRETGVRSHGRSRLGGSMADVAGQLGLQERKGNSARGKSSTPACSTAAEADHSCDLKLCQQQ